MTRSTRELLEFLAMAVICWVAFAASFWAVREALVNQ